jgi:predicted hydrolase (HD superfamily)
MKAYKLSNGVSYRSGYAAAVALAREGKTNKEISVILKNSITPQSISAAIHRETIRQLHQLDKPEVVKGKSKEKK